MSPSAQPHVLQIDSSAWYSRPSLTSYEPRRTADRHILDRAPEIGAVRGSGARLVNLASGEAETRFAHLEVVMCQWRRVESLLAGTGPFICFATRTSLRTARLPRQGVHRRAPSCAGLAGRVARVNRRARSRVSHPKGPGPAVRPAGPGSRPRPGRPGTVNGLAGPADQVTDQIADGRQRLAVVLVHVLGAEPEPDLIVHHPQVKQHISPLWPIHAASLRPLRRAGYDRRDPFASGSQLSMDLSANGRILTGTWAEQTRGDGRYRGAVYTGAIQLIEDDNPVPRRFAGTWAGFGKDGEMNTVPWSLTRVDEHVSEQAVERWNREPQ